MGHTIWPIAYNLSFISQVFLGRYLASLRAQTWQQLLNTKRINLKHHSFSLPRLVNDVFVKSFFSHTPEPADLLVF